MSARVFVFKPTNEPAGRFEVNAPDSLDDAFARFSRSHPVEAYDYLECSGRTWTAVPASPGLKVVEGRIHAPLIAPNDARGEPGPHAGSRNRSPVAPVLALLLGLPCLAASLWWSNHGGIDYVTDYRSWQEGAWQHFESRSGMQGAWPMFTTLGSSLWCGVWGIRLARSLRTRRELVRDGDGSIPEAGTIHPGNSR